jgi:hypothetical protein
VGTTEQSVASEPARRVRFDRNEFSGAFGDLGADFPLLVGMILAAGLPYGYVIALVAGTALAWPARRGRTVFSR